MPAQEITFDIISGIPIHYARPPVATYGSRGKRSPFRCSRVLHDTFIACLQELSDVCPLGPPEVVVSAGAYVNKPGQHGKGQAVDIDAIFWAERDFITDFYLIDKVFYLAVESVLRRHFGIVLNYLYNSAHHDHFHLDLSTPVQFFENSKSRVLYLQASLNHIHGRGVLEDGIWGLQTAEATTEVLRGLGLQGQITSKNTWLAYLSRTADKGFAEAIDTEPRHPAHLYDEIYHLLHDLALLPFQRHRLTAILDTFAQHPDVATLLTASSDDETT